METRPLGKTGTTVSRIGLGCATFGREIEEATCFALMDYAVQHQINLFDTAEAYGGGQARAYRKSLLNIEDVREVSNERHSSERIIGSWLRSTGARDQIILVSKITAACSRAQFREALSATLDRLQTNYLDAYLFHSYNPAFPMEEALAAMQEAKQSGLIRCAGCSNFTAQQIQEALVLSRHGSLRFEVAENICNLVVRDAETELLPLCQKEQIAFFGYSPLGAGFLTGKYSGDRNMLPAGSRFHVIPGHMDIYFGESQFRELNQLHAVAEQWQVPAVQLAIAWVLCHSGVTSVLCGARSTAQLKNALDAGQIVRSRSWLDLLCSAPLH